MSTLRELELVRISPRLLEILRREGLASLTDFQKTAVEEGITRNISQILITYDYEEAYQIGEISVLNKVASNFRTKVLIICPNPHQAEKRLRTLSQRARRLGIPVSSITRRRMATSEGEIKGRIIVSTFRSLSIALRSHPRIMEDLDCILIERLDLIGQPEIGARLETALVTIRGQGLKPQYIAVCSPVADVEDLANWLSGRIVRDRKADVKRIFGVKSFENINESVADLVEFVHGRKEQVMILCASMKEAERLAMELTGTKKENRILDLDLTLGHREELRELASEVEQYYPECKLTQNLKQVITSGVAFMHSGVSRTQRRAITAAWEDELLPVLILPTRFVLASGLRATDVFLLGVYMQEVERGTLDDEGLTILSEWQMNNVLQSAGRTGKDNEGFGTVIVDNESERQRVLSKYFIQQPDGFITPREGEVDSAMDDPENVQDLVLSQLCGRIRVDDDPFMILSRTFWAASNRVGSVDLQSSLLETVENARDLISRRITKSTVTRTNEIPDDDVRLVSVTPEKIEGLVHSRSRDLWHHVVLKAKEGVSCTCESWKYQGIRRHRLCKHLLKFTEFAIEREEIRQYGVSVIFQALRGLEVYSGLERERLIVRDKESIKCTSLGEKIALLGVPVKDATIALRAISKRGAKIHDVLEGLVASRSDVSIKTVRRIINSVQSGEIEYCENDRPGVVENILEETQYMSQILCSLVSGEQEFLLKELDKIRKDLQKALDTID